jgi:hypothetical protein
MARCAALSSTTTEPFSGPVMLTGMGNPSTVVIIVEGTSASYVIGCPGGPFRRVSYQS